MNEVRPRSCGRIKYMNMKKPPFLNEQIYHIVNRGVEKRDIFMDNGDYVRFMHHLYSFNNMKVEQNLRRNQFKMNEVEPRSSREGELVEILAFVLMPNHYHILLRQKIDGGVVKFMQKLGTGFTMFFNKKYERVGPLFQGGFKATLVEENAHFMYVPHYIHLNPLSLMSKQNSFDEVETKIKFLENYKWSSFSDYIGNKNFPSITQRSFLLDLFGGSKKYKQDIVEFLQKDYLENK